MRPFLHGSISLGLSLEHAFSCFAMAVSNFQIVCALAVVAIATFINLPAPRFSQRLQEWRSMGQYFNYRGNAIFYQGKKLMNIGANFLSFDLHVA